MNSKPNSVFTLKNKNNVEARISNYGARWMSMYVPDSKKNLINVIAGFDTIEAYTNPSAAYYGATIGRYANRIAKGIFKLEEKEYRLCNNNDINHLHGGHKGFHNVTWDVAATNESCLLLKYISPDGEEGYPGNVEVFVRYKLTDDNEMKIEFTATTDQTTIINLTNHAYFNLNGAGNGDILNHALYINSDRYTPVDETLIPVGCTTKVAGTSFDFRQPTRIGKHINDNDIQLKYGKGYDHNFVISRTNDNLVKAASVTGDISNIKMDVFTTEPGLQLYTGNFMDGSNTLPNGKRDDYRTAFCLETQHFPDSPNKEHFPSTVLVPGEIHQSTTVFRFYNED